MMHMVITLGRPYKAKDNHPALSNVGGDDWTNHGPDFWDRSGGCFACTTLIDENSDSSNHLRLLFPPRGPLDGNQSQRMEESEFGERLVSVRAIVMEWDERYAGWQPSGRGGVSSVVLYQRLCSFGEVGTNTEPEPDQPGPSHAALVTVSSTPLYEYTIRGTRMEDGNVTIFCRLTKDTSYRQVMPTFHHWQIDEDKYGLAFQSTYEASKFHNRVQKAVDHLYQQSKSSSAGSNTEEDDFEDDVFMPVELPLSRSESFESAVTSKSAPAKAATSAVRYPTGTTVVPAIVHPPPRSPAAKKKFAVSATGVLSGMAASLSPSGRTPTWPKRPTPSVSKKASTASATPYPYALYRKEPGDVTVFMKPPKTLQRPASTGGLQLSPSRLSFAAQPSARSVMLTRSSGLEKRESTSSLRVPLIHHLPPAPVILPQRDRRGKILRSSFGRASPAPVATLRRERCFYCKSFYSQQENRKGACPRAPDPCSKWIRRSTCVWCAECAVVHCAEEWSEDDDPFSEADVCSCSPDVPMKRFRWMMLACLSFVLPCLCLYPPLLFCYRCCRRRGWVGGRHRPSGSTQSSGSGGRSSSAARMSTPEPSSSHHR